MQNQLSQDHPGQLMQPQEGMEPQNQVVGVKQVQEYFAFETKRMKSTMSRSLRESPIT